MGPTADFGRVIQRGVLFWMQTLPTLLHVRGLFAKLRDVTLVATMLGLARSDVETILGEWAECPDRKTYAQPDRKGAWSYDDLLVLGQLWSNGKSLADIARFVKRSPSSVGAKRRGLGLPSRKRIGRQMAHDVLAAQKAAIPADPAIILTWQQASLMTFDERRGRTWYVRNCIDKLTMTAHKETDKVRWHVAANIEVAYRHFAFQSPIDITEDFLIKDDSLKSHSSWEQLPPRRGKKSPYFIRTRADVYIQEQDYIRRECLAKSGCFFWTKRIGGDRVSRRYRRSAAAAHGIAA